MVAGRPEAGAAMTGLNLQGSRARQPVTGPGYAPRRADNRAAETGRRIGGALRRQGWLFLGLVAAVAALGLLVALAERSLDANAILFWSGVGACVGFALASLRELSRETIVSAARLGKQRSFTALGAAPELSGATLRELPPDQRTPLGCLAFLPASSFATAFRDLQGAFARDGLVAFLSSADGERAAMAAMCAAASAAQQGRRVIVVDCDLRRRALTHELGIEPDVGVAEVVFSAMPWGEVVGQEPETGLSYIPALASKGAIRSLAEAPGFPALLASLREGYDLVVLSCPPAAAGGAELAAKADKIVVVAAWDETTFAALRGVARVLPRNAKTRPGLFVCQVPAGRRFGRLRAG